MNWKRISFLVLNTIAVSLLFSFILTGKLTPSASTAVSPYLALGFLILTAHLMGLLAKEFGFPALTGNLLAGILFGPSVLGFMSRPDIHSLELINAIALSFIAITAGGELRLKSLKKQGRVISWITGSHTVVIFFGMFIVMLPALKLSHIQSLEEPRLILMAAILLSVIAIAKSPASTIAIINEYRARGPFTDVVLGVTMVKDVVVLVVFALAMGLVRGLRGVEPVSLSFLGKTFGEIIISILAGIVFGWLMILFYRHVAKEITVFIVIAAFAAHELANFAGLENMLMCMVAGFVVQNFSRQGPLMIEGIEKSHLPIYVIFFSIAGAGLDFSYFGAVYWVVCIFVIVRTVMIFGSTWAGARISGASDTVRRYAWTGFLTNAGLTLSIVIIVEQAYPRWGGALKAIVISVIAINQIVGPILFKIGLIKSHENRA